MTKNKEDVKQEMISLLENSIVQFRTARKNHRVGDHPDYIVHVADVLIDPQDGRTNVKADMVPKYGKRVAESIAARWKNGLGDVGQAEKFVNYCMRQEAKSRELLEKIKAA